MSSILYSRDVHDFFHKLHLSSKSKMLPKKDFKKHVQFWKNADFIFSQFQLSGRDISHFAKY